MPAPTELEYAALRSLLSIAQAAQSVSPSQVIDLYLEEAVRLTESEIGFFHFVAEDEKSVHLHTWSEATRAVCEVAERGTEYPIEQAGIWLDALRLRNPVIHNDYDAAERRGGLPAGHVPVLRELVVPVVEDDRVVVVMGVGNRQTPYDESDAAGLSLLAENAWLIVRRKQAEEQREALIGELEQALADVKRLSGMVPICAGSKKVRDDRGFWQQVEEFISERSDAQFSHGMCPDCMLRYYGRPHDYADDAAPGDASS